MVALGRWIFLFRCFRLGRSCFKRGAGIVDAPFVFRLVAVFCSASVIRAFWSSLLCQLRGLALVGFRGDLSWVGLGPTSSNCGFWHFLEYFQRFPETLQRFSGTFSAYSATFPALYIAYPAPFQRLRSVIPGHFQRLLQGLSCAFLALSNIFRKVA